MEPRRTDIIDVHLHHGLIHSTASDIISAYKDPAIPKGYLVLPTRSRQLVTLTLSGGLGIDSNSRQDVIAGPHLSETEWEGKQQQAFGSPEAK